MKALSLWPGGGARCVQVLAVRLAISLFVGLVHHFPVHVQVRCMHLQHTCLASSAFPVDQAASRSSCFLSTVFRVSS